MKKIETKFIIDQFDSGVNNYIEATKNLGLWESESHVFEQYVRKHEKILDLGCGTGRTTFPLIELGYNNIIGVDLTPSMINAANLLAKNNNVDVQFQVQDATKLEFGIAEFDTVFFSFNGLMTIPNHNNRVKAVQEVNRVLKKGGLFIFTTHDREQEEQFVEFWKTEKTKWEKGLQNQTLYEFGDIITSSKNETQDIYLHVPNKKEVTSLLEIEGFVVEETFYRNEKFQENENVLKQSGECRFWITRKI